jgi:hypothetical protein
MTFLFFSLFLFFRLSFFFPFYSLASASPDINENYETRTRQDFCSLAGFVSIRPDYFYADGSKVPTVYNNVTDKLDASSQS